MTAKRPVRGSRLARRGFVPNESLVEYAMNDARNQAAERGATHVTLSPPALGAGEDGTSSATMTGFACRCAASVAPPAGVQVVPAGAQSR